MDTISFLIIGQVILLLLAAVVFLALYARKQKKDVSHLQGLLLEYKEGLSGDHLTRYFQLSIDDTTAHSSQETVALKPDAAPDQMAVSLRYHGLANELALLQTYNGELSPWKNAIKPYNELAEQIHEYIEQVPESVKAELLPKIDDLENQLAEARSQHEQVKNQLDHYHQLDTVYREAAKEDVDKQQLEIQLHHALLALAEDVENAAALREVIYLMHEGYLDAKDSNRPEPDADANDQPSPMEPEVSAAETDQSADLSEEDAQAMHDLIEKFTEESAELVERIYMLNNENKMLSGENQDLKKQIKAYTEHEEADEESAPMIAGLKMKIESQIEEILKLQSNFKQLEDKYLALYTDKPGYAGSSTPEASRPAMAETMTDEPEPEKDTSEDVTTPQIEPEPDNIEPPTVSEKVSDDEIASEITDTSTEAPDSEPEDVDAIFESAAAAQPASEFPDEPVLEDQVKVTEDNEPSEDKLVDTDLEEDIDPDAILAEMEGMTTDSDSDRKEPSKGS